jgi:peptidoglycan/xylan/chitin deacetylase (PgdA/CDA1 family)
MPAPSSPVPAQRYGRIPVAITVDDIPGTVDAAPGYPKSRVMAEIIRTLRAHQVAQVVGFANGVAAEGPDALAGLSAWVEAGFEIGNHSYSHRSARDLSVPDFLADVAQNQAFLLPLLSGKRPVYFRFPYLERGNSPSERIQITQGLARDGYRVANVSIDFADWAFVSAYTRCAARGDQAALQALSEAYLQHASAALFWSVEAGQRLFARSIPQVLLLHAHLATAQNLDALLRAYEREGVVWIGLDEALRDPAYAEPADVDHGDTTIIVEATRRSEIELRSGVPRGIPLLELACR